MSISTSGGRQSASSDGSSANGGSPLIRAEGIWKIFGRNAEKVIGTPDVDLTGKLDGGAQLVVLVAHDLRWRKGTGQDDA